MLALRVEPGQLYDTYTGWFLDQQTRRWRLYASGRKWSAQRSVTSLLPGCFVEVPCPPHVERSGHIPRAADFRGWCQDDSGKWHMLDVMNGSKTDANREQSSCMWARSDDGWFRMAMGGMTRYRYPKGVDVCAPKLKTPPDYMSESAQKALELPNSISVKLIVRQGTRVHLELKSTANGRSKAKVFFGPEDALTFDKRWAKHHDLGELAPGIQRASFDAASAAGFCRILVTNDTGSYFSTETLA